MPSEFDHPKISHNLYRALAACGIDAEKIPHIAERLRSPPASFYLSSQDPPGTAERIRSRVGFDRDMAARMLRLNEGKPDPKITWKQLTRLERKRAKRLWNWSLAPDCLAVNPKGRPLKIDSAHVLYCTRIISEASARAQFRFRRPMGGGAPGGPMWRALIESLPLKFRAHTETIAEIVAAARSKNFAGWCQKLGLGPSSADVTAHPATFRSAISLARRWRPRKRR
jgi:hypothetical protein